MRVRLVRFSRSAAVVTAVALAAAACGDAAPPPAKTADSAPQSTTSTAPTAPAGAPSSEPAAATAAPIATAQAAAPAADGYVFKKKMPAVGTKVSEEETKTTSLTLNIGGKTAKDKPVKVVRSERSTVEKTVEVLAVTADAVTKVKVNYKDHSKVETKDGAEKPSKEPVAGKTYIVEAKGGSVTVLTEKGAPAPAEEAKAVQDDFKKLGKPNDLQKALPDSPIKVGDKVDSLAQALRERVTKDDGESKITIENSSITLAKINEAGGSKTGVFNVSLDMVIEKTGMIIRMKMGGEVELRMDDGFPVSMSFQAPVTVATPPGAAGPKISGAGLNTMSSTRRTL